MTKTEPTFEVVDRRGHGYFIVDNLVLEEYGADIGPIGIAVYCALSKFADNKTRESFPRHSTIANLIGAHVRTVKTYLGKLVDAGLLKIKPRFSADGSRSSNLYILLPVRPKQESNSEARHQEHDHPPTDVPTQGTSDAYELPPVELSPVDSLPEGVPSGPPDPAPLTRYAPSGQQARDAPTTFQGWQDVVRSARNKPAALVRMVETLFPGAEVPDYGYVGKVAKIVGGEGRLADLLWSIAPHPPTGDLLAYAMGKAGKGDVTVKKKPRYETLRICNPDTGEIETVEARL